MFFDFLSSNIELELSVRLIMYFLKFYVPMRILLKFAWTNRTVVRKIEFDLNKNNFIIKRNSLISPFETSFIVSKEDLMNTSDIDLIKKRINFINVKTMDPFYAFSEKSWKEKRLMMYLIDQNIVTTKRPLKDYY